MCNLMICGRDLVQNSFAPSQLKSQEDRLSCFSLALTFSPQCWNSWVKTCCGGVNNNQRCLAMTVTARQDARKQIKIDCA